MKIFIYFFVGFILINSSEINAQNIENKKAEGSISKISSDTTFTNGFYILDKYWDMQGKNFRVDYQQNISDIEFKKRFLFFEKKIKGHFVKSSGKVVDVDYERIQKYIRGLKNKSYYSDYLVKPIPIAIKQDVIRIYPFKSFNNDSTICNYGLTIKFSYLNSSSFSPGDFSEGNGQFVGLIIDNKLVGIAKYYINDKTYSSGENNAKYLVFTFQNQTFEDVDYYEKVLFNQILIKP